MRTTYPVNVAVLTLAASSFLVLACNLAFWRVFLDATGGFGLRNFPLHAATALIFIALFNAALTLLSFRLIIKPVLVTLFLSTSFAAYFMSSYGIAIDAAMIQNVFETDVREAGELISWKLGLSVFLLGVLPSVAVWRARIGIQPFLRGVLVKVAIVVVSLLLAAGLLITYFKTYAPTFREHRELRLLLAPTNFINAGKRYVLNKFSRPVVIAQIGTDAIKGPRWASHPRRTVTIIVVGETARAMNFSLNGYARDTNPGLSKQPDLINFSDVQSCGTATAVSVPCIFSGLGRENYSESAAKSRQGLLDVLSHAGFRVIWRDNNTGCKGTCDRVEHEDFSQPIAGNPLCNSEECFDEHLLGGLPELIRSSTEDLFIVLHQKGSHGPAYWKRYPSAFDRWGPVCQTNDLEKCSTQSIVDAYDNTILYTDHFLSKTISLLRMLGEKDGVDTSFMYFSDHGESLGEKHMYLHGAPYIISPEEQRRVPFMIWLSDGFRSRFHIDQTCLAVRAQQPFSHDNVFHSALGMLNVITAVYNPALDIFRPCDRVV